MTNQQNLFIQWLDEQESATDLSDYEVAKRGGFSHSVLSRARVEGIPPKWDICVKIADVFGVSPISVFRKAGLLPPGPESSANWEDWQHLLGQLSPNEQQEIYQIAMLKLNLRQQGSPGNRARLKPGEQQP